MGWWHLTWKDLRLQVRDRRSLAVLLVQPLIFITIVGFSTGKLLGWRASNQIIQVAWVDRDGGDLAKRLQTRLAEQRDLQVVMYADTESAKRDVFSGKVTMSLTIGSEFQKRIDDLELRDFFARKLGKGRLAGGFQNLDVSIDTKPTWSWVAKLVTNNLYSMTMDEVFPTVAKRHNLGRMLINNMEAAADEEASGGRQSSESGGVDSTSTTTALGGLTPSARPEVVQTTVADGRSTTASVYDRLVPGFTVMFTFFLVNVMARSFLAERDIGTLRRLRISPLTPIGLLVGKTLPYFLISLLQSFALFFFGRLMFDMTWGEQPILLVPLIVCTSLAATSLGLLIATYVQTDSQVSSYGNLIVITLAGISGCFVPREWMSDAMKDVSVVTPHAWSLIGYLEVLTNPQADVAVIVKCCLMLLGFAAAFFVAGYRRFRSMT